MKPRQLEVFHAIMVSPSLTEAARSLGISQPAVSATLKHMEDELGLRLFDRLGGRLVPTAEAELLMPEVERVFVRLQTVRRIIKAIREGSSSFLSIMGVPTLADTLVPRALVRMRARRPGIRIRLDIGLARQIAERVARREADLGLIYGPNPNPDIGAEMVGDTTVACAMPADHPYAELAVLTPRNLAAQTVITFPKGAPIRDRVDEAFAAAGLELTTIAEVTYSLTACFLALEGAGIALIDPLIGSTRAFPNLVIRPFEPSLRVPIQLLYLKNRPRSRLSNEMIGELRRTFADSLAIAAELAASLGRIPTESRVSGKRPLK